ncbi:hypothetical protein Ancab_038232 [Ancistrocladus abbreviatus]
MCHCPADSNEQMKPGDENLAEANNCSSKFHQVDPEPGTAEQDGSNSFEAPLISPHASLTSSDSFASSCSDSSVDINPNERDYVEVDREDQKFEPNGHVRKSNSVSLVNGLDQSDVAAHNNTKEGEDGGILRDVEITGSTDSHEIKADHGEGACGSLDDENETSHSFDDEMDSQIWMPPEAENEEDDREDSIATLDDDDDEYGDGTKWGKSSCFDGFEEGINRGVQFKEAKQKAMEEVMNGKFKNLVSQMLKSVGVDNSERDGESWVDIVTSLAWQAASFLKPGAIEGKAMDPAGYVKVKCIATGSRSESQLIKGLVFKKHAAHKHMPTKYNNPKLLLIRGMLGQSSGLSSFNSMISQEKDNQKKDNMADDLKPLIENLEACQPNVVLVEKSVSRDVLEAIHKMGMTLVIDMKLHRLGRVARCTGSPILSSDIMLSQKLKQCDSFYFEKFVEEHAHVYEGEKKPRKTLMFVEGCPTRLDCTILLKGSHSDELKRIKYVVQCAVVMAYHFILETSFLLDQKAMFSTIAIGGISCTLPFNQQYSRAGSFSSSVCHEESAAAAASANRHGALISNGSNEGSHHLEETNTYAASQQTSCLGNDANSSVPDKDTTVDTAPAYESDVPIANGFREEQSPQAKESTSTIVSSRELDIPISNGFHQGWPSRTNLASEGNSMGHDEPRAPDSFSEMSSISASLRKVIGENLSHVSPTAYQSMCTYLGLNERESDAQASLADRVLQVEVLAQGDLEAKDCSNGEKLLSSDSQPSAANSEAPEEARKAVGDNEDSTRGKDDINSVLDSESILVLMSSRNASRGTICEQSHFSHIKFYRNFDVPLGKFLRDNLLNQSLHCKTCGELPEAHFYYYAHHNKQLTIRVKHLPNTICLPGESEGKLWMWSRCGKCKPNKGGMKSTKRVVISAAARRLSFGKFLELSFSSDSSFNGLSSCGHSLHRDFLYFFGSGPMVAMFRFSRVSTYTVSVPPQKFEFNYSIKGEWLEKETENVYTKGMLVFTEVADYLKKIKSRFSGITLNLGGSLKEFSDIEEMLNAERAEFEDDIKSTCIDNSQSVRNFLCLNRLRWELLLVACIWDQRLQVLLSDSAASVATAPDNMMQRTDLDNRAEGETEATPATMAGDEMTQAAAIIATTQAITDNGHRSAGIEGVAAVLSDGLKAFENCSNVAVPIEGTAGQDDSIIKEIPYEQGMVQGSMAENIQGPSLGSVLPSVLSPQVLLKPMTTDHQTSDNNGQTDTTFMSDHLLADRTIPILANRDDCSIVNKNTSERVSSPPICNLENSEGWFWNPFSGLWQECMKDLDKNHLPIFEFLAKFKLPHPPDFLPTVSQVIIEEVARLHIPLINHHYIVSDYEGEISSIIACALALMEDFPSPEQDLNQESQKERVAANSSDEGSFTLPRAVSAPSPHYSLSMSSDSDFLRSTPSMTLESRFSSFDGLNLLDSLVSFSALHPEIPLGIEKYLGKGKYSVVCLYAREFRALRNQCCPSELDYISSLSRCKIWDAKGGKSKSFFAKTLDDRLIIKEIKKTEFESFMKFAPDYFHHMNQSFASGNQTCLAKILGIYQVTIRQAKNGKEVKHDLMVMENLSFGRNITRQYDLKGALHARFTAGDGSGDVLLDQNFVNDMNISPIYVGQKAKRLLQRAVWNDTTFLTSINVMDYSLLVGVDRQRQELVCGIIDYLRQYTWDKQLETWVKSSLVVPRNVLPTIISPKEYKKRFRKFMDTHFLTVPDHWCSQRSSNPCKLCGIRGDETPQLKPMNPEELNGF